jgi:biotin synthase-like enzyme
MRPQAAASGSNGPEVAPERVRFQRAGSFSIFTQGYLTTGGQGHAADLELLRSAGFELAGYAE